MLKSTLVIGGLDPTGGAGISADARTLSLIGVQALTVSTCVVPQTGRGVLCVHPIPPEILESQIISAFESARVDSCKISTVYSKEGVNRIVEVLSSYRQKRRFPVVFDPVMQASAGGDLAGTAIEVFSSLLKICDVITPNLNEAVSLASILGIKGVSRPALGIELTRFLDDSGLRTVVITGGSSARDIIYRRTDGSITSKIVEGKPLPADVHGSGCMHSSVIAGLLAKGYDVIDACIYAKFFVENTIDLTIRYQKHAPLLLPVILPHESRYQYAEEVYKSAMELCRVLPVEHLPEVGTNIAYSLPAPEDLDDVCALTSRIIKWEGTPRTFGRPRFGVESHMARLAFALARKVPTIRSCCNLRYSPELVKAIRNSKLRCIELRRDDEPAGTTTMDWIADRISAQNEEVSFVYDRGLPGKEAMIRVLGRDPQDVVRKVRMVFRKNG